MRNVAPDLILTQDLCQVCAPSGNEVSELLKVLPSKPAILWLTPKSLDQIFEKPVQRAFNTSHSHIRYLVFLLNLIEPSAKHFRRDFLDSEMPEGFGKINEVQSHLKKRAIRLVVHE